jgi:glyoxylase-like metal-dependent hydrolase (beta-lactamase superfamily II)/rhodanese-related sulfurtransferase
VLAIETIETQELGNRSYIAHDGEAAIVIDPQRDLDRILDRLDELGLQALAVADTHLHNDYLSGGLALARRLNIPYLFSADESVGFDRVGVTDDTDHTYGSMTVRVIATPGHTAHHVAYFVSSNAVPDTALFTGGSLLYGAVGRTDLVESISAENLGAAQFRSVHRLAAELPAWTPIYPTHGFGSFCAAAPTSSAGAGTIGDEQRRNPALLTADEAGFVAALVAGFTPYPTYYREMAPLNRLGPAAADLTPPSLSGPVDLAARIDDGQWVLDLRPRREFAADHLVGTIGFEIGPQFGTYLGWLAPFAAPMTLIGPTGAAVAAAQRQLTRIGWDRPAAAAVGDLAHIGGKEIQHTSYPVMQFADLPRDLATLAGTVIDVRRDDELRATGAVSGSRHYPLHQLVAGNAALPAGPLLVHCASGFRASIAASLLHRSGHDVVLIDDPFVNAGAVGIVVHA